MRGRRTIHSVLLTAWLLLGVRGQSASSAASFAAVYQEGPPQGVESTQADEHERTNSLDASPVVIRAALSHAAYTRTTPATLALKIDLTAALGEASVQRPALNLALVIDRSGSMADDDKFEYAMQAARLVVENLSPRDIVSVIAFNQDAIVLSPAGRAVNKAFLDHRLDEIGPVGWTNLSAGLLEAFAQIDAQASDEQAKQVIVLTDGLANRGITAPEQLRRLVESARRRGIGVSTMGCGEEFDEEVLIALAEAGGGRYTYIRSSEQIPKAMSAELNGLLRVVAQNVTIKVAVTDHLNITRVQGRRLEEPVRSFAFTLGDVREGERGVLLLNLAPRDFTPGAVAAVDCTLSFDRTDVAARRQQVVRLEAVMLEDEALVQESADRGVVLYAEVLGAMEKVEDAVLGLDTDEFRDAATLFERRYETARRYALEARDQQLLNQTFMLKHFMAELSAAHESGLLHGHEEARRRLKKEVEYRRYLREHHRRFD